MYLSVHKAGFLGFCLFSWGGLRNQTRGLLEVYVDTGWDDHKGVAFLGFVGTTPSGPQGCRLTPVFRKDVAFLGFVGATTKVSDHQIHHE